MPLAAAREPLAPWLRTLSVRRTCLERRGQWLQGWHGILSFPVKGNTGRMTSTPARAVLPVGHSPGKAGPPGKALVGHRQV